MMPDLRGAKAIAALLEQVWRVPVSAEDVYWLIRSEALPCVRQRRIGARKGKLFAHSAEVTAWAKDRFARI